MKNLSITVISAVLLISSLANASPLASTAITHVTIVDTRTGQLTSDMTVVVEGERIAKIGKSSGFLQPSASRVIDAQGQYLIPGLWDMHAHMFFGPDLFRHLSLFLANGVTGIRDTGGAWKYLFPYVEARRQGRPPAGMSVTPRIVIAGAIIDGSPPYMKDMMSVRNAEEARAAVDLNKRRGADYIKAYSYLSRDAYFALADEARKQGLTFVGHVPYSISAAEASDAGQRSIEHSDGILLGASTDESAIR